MEPTTENIAEMENTKTEQSTDKENETVEQIQDNVKETTNENPGETVEEEEAHVKENRDSSCPMVIEEVIPTNDDEPTKDDLPKMDNEVTNDDKNSKLETNTHLSPPSEALHPEEGINPTVEETVEKNIGSSQVSSDTLKNEGDSVEVDKETSVDNDETVTVPDIKTSEEKDSLNDDVKTVIEQEKPQEEHDIISSGNHNKVSTGADTKIVEENNEKIDEGEGNNTNMTDHGRGVVNVHQETAMDIDKGSEAPVSEIVSKVEDTPSEPLLETSMDIEKEPHVPATEDITENEERSDVSAAVIPENGEKEPSVFPATQPSSDHDEPITTLEAEPAKDVQLDAPDSKLVTDASIDATNVDVNVSGEATTTTEMKDNSRAPEINDVNTENASMGIESSPSNIKIEVGAMGDTNNGDHNIDSAPHAFNGTMSGAKHSFLLDDISDGNDSGTEEDQSAFMKELEIFFRERNMEFKPPKFYGEGLNCLKLLRAVTRLGGYDKVTGSKLWRQVGESFRPPKTCTTVSWTFRGFYEKALLEYERHKVSGGELHIPLASEPEAMNIDNQASGSGRARRDAAARAMQGWHSQRHGNGEVSDPTNKDKNSVPQLKREKQIVTPGLLKRKRPSSAEHGAKTTTQMSKPMLDVTVVDVGQPADWVKINVQRTQDCFEVYALVPGLVREEVRVQSDPAGRLVISGEPENPLNPWGATPFKKVVSLPARIDPHHTSAVVTLNGQLFVRVPLEQSD